MTRRLGSVGKDGRGSDVGWRGCGIAASAGLLAVVTALRPRKTRAQKRAEQRARNQARLADEQRQRDQEIMPRLRVRWLGRAPGAVSGLSLNNRGGTARNIVWVGTYASNLHAAWASLTGYHFIRLSADEPPHRSDFTSFETNDLGPLPKGVLVGLTTETLALIAQSIDRRWWDCLQEKPVGANPRAYLLEQLTGQGLQEFADRVYQVGRLELSKSPVIPPPPFLGDAGHTPEGS